MTAPLIQLNAVSHLTNYTIYNERTHYNFSKPQKENFSSKEKIKRCLSSSTRDAVNLAEKMKNAVHLQGKRLLCQWVV